MFRYYLDKQDLILHAVGEIAAHLYYPSGSVLSVSPAPNYNKPRFEPLTEEQFEKYEALYDRARTA